MRESTPVPASLTGINDCWNRIGVHGDGSCEQLKEQVHCRNCPVYSEAAVQLLDRELPPDYQRAWAEHFAKEKTVAELDTHSVMIFRVGGEWLALPTSVFQEVSDMKPIHSLPHRRNGLVLGLVNVRGELLVCVSLAAVLGIEAAALVKGDRQNLVHQRLLVVRRDGQRLVFPVDETRGLHRFHPRELQEAPATVGKAAATYTRKMLRWEDKSAGLLDETLLFQTLNRSLA